MTSAIPFPLAEILREAVALNQALLDHNLVEAQHRTRLIVTLAEIYAMRRAFRLPEWTLFYPVSMPR